MKKVLLAVASCLSFIGFSQETITFSSNDAVTITADYYEVPSSDRFILLFHQATWSRGAYKETAVKLNKLGYTCLAVDLRSGGTVNGTPNLTCKDAKSKGKKMRYIDAYPDILASITYVKNHYKPKQLLLLGSSYSSSLVLHYAGQHPGQVHGVMAFSPGEYFDDKKFIQKEVTKLVDPVFVSSKRSEKKDWEAMFAAMPSKNKHAFIPTIAGQHGARSLWSKMPQSAEYWIALEQFLSSIK